MWVRRTGLKCLEMAGYVAAGYALVSLCIAIIAYAVTFAVVIYEKNRKIKLKKV